MNRPSAGAGQHALLRRLGMVHPLIQAPMAGVSTPALAAAVSNAGGLGAIAVGATDAAGARAMIAQTRAATAGAFMVNAFVHATPRADPEREAAWCRALAPQFATFDAKPPHALRTIYRSLSDDPDMQAVLLDAAPAVVSFHFGLPNEALLAGLSSAGCLLAATATSVEEGQRIAAAGLDFIVAQGWDAGGHRGQFDPAAPDARQNALSLTRALVVAQPLPVVTAGAIMDGSDLRAALHAGAIAGQLGTAFIDCPESAARPAHRAALRTASGTQMTSAISGRPARCLVNRFTALADLPPVPDYPRAYDAGKALDAAAVAKGEQGFAPQWAGTGAARARTMTAGELVALIARELTT